MNEEVAPTIPRLIRCQQFMSVSGGLAVVILREPTFPGLLLCDGKPLVAARPTPCSAQLIPIGSGDVAPGERFADHHSGLTVVCPRGGCGQLTFEGRPLRRVKAPASFGAVAANAAGLDIAAPLDEGAGSSCMQQM